MIVFADTKTLENSKLRNCRSHINETYLIYVPAESVDRGTKRTASKKTTKNDTSLAKF